ncbi:MAG TPA: Rieske 2Fe-2S domain-containing protein [Stellaceae bacterium]|nr:Rieske 2Fe-2S domain-containing protein [Stellaceae bacterium]
MTSHAENELLTHVGPDTPMGTLMRQYWLPACLSAELTADGDPLRLMLLGEKLIAFRDTAGRIGVFDHRCPHRCASLFFGRNEEGGIRCAYHGWKFDTAGNCLEMPNLPADQDFSAKVKARAYSVAERNGVVYVYMGASKKLPPLPALEATLAPAAEVDVTCVQRECNWLQALEGDIDTSHFSFLHTGKVRFDDVDPNHIERFQLSDRAPRYHVKSTDYGTMYTAYRPADPGYVYYRFAHFILPFWTLFPNGPLTDNVLAQAWVPMDDTHTMAISFLWKHKTPVLGRDAAGGPLPYLDRKTATLPSGPDWYGRWRAVANQHNDYLIDREVQRSVSYTGIGEVFQQDAAMTQSMGEISDRTLEHLAPSDRLIVATRRRLVDAAKALREGAAAPQLDSPHRAARLRSGDVIAPEGQAWAEAYEQSLRAALHPGMLDAAE